MKQKNKTSSSDWESVPGLYLRIFTLSSLLRLILESKLVLLTCSPSTFHFTCTETQWCDCRWYDLIWLGFTGVESLVCSEVTGDFCIYVIALWSHLIFSCNYNKLTERQTQKRPKERWKIQQTTQWKRPCISSLCKDFRAVYNHSTK